jgi:hypothetical protein
MPFSITCPSCSATLKTATAIQVGRKIQCPKCKSSFAVSNDNMREADDSRPAVPATSAARKTEPPARKPAPSAPEGNPFSFGDESPATKKPLSLDDDDDRPKARKRRDDDEEEERPRARKRRDEDEEEEEDRPRRRTRPRDDDEDDDPPRAKRRRDDDDDDDRPSRRRRDEEDDEDDRPRRKPKKKKKKGNVGLKIGLIAAGLLALAGIGFLIYYLLGGGGNYDTDMIALMPSDVNSLDYENWEKAVDIPKFKKLVDREFDTSPKFSVFKSAGLSASDLKSTLEGSTEKFDNLLVARLKSAPDKGKITSGGSESKSGEKSYWKVKDKGKGAGDLFVAFPEDTLVVVTSKEDLIKSVLSKESGKIVISETLQELAKKASGGDSWHANLRKEGKEGKEGKGTAVRIEISSSSANTTIYSLHDSAESAGKAVDEAKKKQEDAKKNIDDVMKFIGAKFNDAQKESFKRMILDAQVGTDGSFATITMKLDLTPFDNLDDGLGGMPFGFR